MAIFYVDQVNGNDDNAGSALLPWKTIAKVNATSFTSGDIVYFTGTFRENLIIPTSGVSYIGRNATILGSDDIGILEWTLVTGTEYKCTLVADPKVVAWWNNGWIKLTKGTKGSLTANQWAWNSGELNVNIGKDPTDERVEAGKRTTINSTSKSNITIAGFTTLFSTRNGVNILGGENVVVSGNTVRYTANDGINGSSGATNVVVERNTIEYCGAGWGAGGAPGDGVSFHDSCTGIIRNNTIRFNDKTGIDNIDDTDFESYGNFIEGNYYDIYVTTSTTGQQDFHHNIIINNLNRPSLYMHTGVTTTVNFYNNLIYSDNKESYGCLIYSGTANIKNNIIVGYSQGIKLSAGATANLANNNVWGSTTPYYGCSADDASISANPLFVDRFKRNFHLATRSPCIGKGIDVGLTTDYSGESLNTPKDIGPYKFTPAHRGRRVKPWMQRRSFITGIIESAG
jgi:hypothetical protein